MKWIYRENADRYDWYAFRKSFFTEECESVFLHIASMGEYAVFLNGIDVGRGPIRSFDSCKRLERRDISMFLNAGENTITILSLKLENGGLAARITCGKTILCETDAHWEMKKFRAISGDTSRQSPPLEPVRRCEEHFDARIDPDLLAGSDHDAWEPAQTVSFDDVTIEDYTGEPASETLVMPQRVISLLGVAARSGFGFRLRNPQRVSNPVTKQNLDIFVMTVAADHAFEAACTCGSGTVYVNGKRATEKTAFRQGENIVAVYNTIGEPEFFAVGACSLRPVPGGICGVCGFETDSNYFAWAYPAYDPVCDARTREIIDGALRARTAAELPAEIRQNLQPCEVLENSTGFLTGLDQYTSFPGCFTDPALRLPVSGEAPDLTAENIHGLLTPNTDCAAVRGDAAFIVDFGVEQMGYITFSVCAKQGQIIEIEPFDLVSDSGKNHNPLECIRYVCKDGWQTYTSFYTKGFRYLSVRVCAAEKMRIRSIGVVSAKRSARCLANFASDDPLLNDIYQMGIQTAWSCMQDTYVDCPGFEQVYWAGDAKVTAHANLVSIGDYDYDYECLKILADSMTDAYIRRYHPGDKRFENGQYLVCPAFGNFCDGGLPSWSFMWLLQVYDNYLYSGNTDHMKALLPAVKRMLSNCERMMSSRGLFAMEGAWNLIEWGENDLLPCGEVTACNIYLYRSYVVASRMTKDIGESENSRIYAEKAAALKQAINQYCWNDAMNAYVDSVRDAYGYELYLDFFRKRGLKPVDYKTFENYTRISEQTNAIACMYGAADGARKNGAMAVVNNIKNNGYIHKDSGPAANTAAARREISDIVTVGSPFGLYYSFGALCENEDDAGMLQVMRRDYSRMIARGTTTSWEGFGKADDPGWTRSVCHGWGASPAIYLITHIVGIRPAAPGFREFIFRPRLCGLKRIKAAVPTPRGPIFIHIDSEKGIQELRAPDGCKPVNP